MSEDRIEVSESKLYEFKLTLTEKLERSVVAFLNSEMGGIIYIGVDDDGKITGVKNPDELQLQISDRIKNNIRPQTQGLYDIVLEKKSNLYYIKIIISSGTEKSYYIKSFGMTPDGCFTRVGSQTQSLTQQKIENLFSRRTRNSLKLIESPHQDLTFKQLKIYYSEHNFDLNENFEKSLDFFTPDRKYNVLAFLFADKNDITIKVAKYSGTDKYYLVENNEYGFCSLITATNRVLEKLKVENKTFAKITPGAREERTLYDNVAMREAVINAFVHNDYSDLMSPVFEIFSDRLEITSYGGLIDGMTKEELVSGVSRPRSREIMRIYRDVELVEQLGSGMNRMMKVYKPDIFKISPNFFHVVFYFNKDFKTEFNGIKRGNEDIKEGADLITSQKLPKDFPKTSQRLPIEEVPSECPEIAINTYLAIKQNPYATLEELSKELGITDRSIKTHISLLKQFNLIERVGGKTHGHWQILDSSKGGNQL